MPKKFDGLTNRQIWHVFVQGVAPSEIDEVFNLPKGKAKQAVIEHWAKDRAKWLEKRLEQ